MDLCDILDLSERFVLSDKPRITKLEIDWGDEKSEKSMLLNQ